MIYSPEDVKRILAKVLFTARDLSWFFKNDNIPPKVIMIRQLEEIIETVEKEL